MNNHIVCAPGGAARLALRGLIGAIQQFASDPSHATHAVLVDWEDAFDEFRSNEIRLARASNGWGSAGRASGAARQCPCVKVPAQTPAAHDLSRHVVAGHPFNSNAVESEAVLSRASAQQPGGGAR